MNNIWPSKAIAIAKPNTWRKNSSMNEFIYIRSDTVRYACTFLILHQVLPPFHFSVCMCNWRWRMDTKRNNRLSFSEWQLVVATFSLSFSLSLVPCIRHLMTLQGILVVAANQWKQWKTSSVFHALQRYIRSDSVLRSRLFTNENEWFLKEYTFHMQLVFILRKNTFTHITSPYKRRFKTEPLFSFRSSKE